MGQLAYVKDTIKNIREATDLYLEPVEDDVLPMPRAEKLELAV